MLQVFDPVDFPPFAAALQRAAAAPLGVARATARLVTVANDVHGVAAGPVAALRAAVLDKVGVV